MLDTRNAFEVAMGTFEGAVDPGLKSFGEFKDFTAQKLDPAKHRRIAMFCTGGIRCEKASAYLLARGFAEVFHLKGGILKYLEGVPEAESRWRGRMLCVRRARRARPRLAGARRMSDLKTLSERIDVLETRLAYQDETIETLNQTITAQWKQIDALTRQLAALNDRPGRGGDAGAGPGQRTPAALLTAAGQPCIFSQIASATATSRITPETTGMIFLLLPLRGEAFSA